MRMNEMERDGVGVDIHLLLHVLTLYVPFVDNFFAVALFFIMYKYAAVPKLLNKTLV